MLRLRTNVVTATATGLLANNLLGALEFSSKESLRHAIYLYSMVTHERIQLCWQNAFKKKLLLMCHSTFKKKDVFYENA